MDIREALAELIGSDRGKRVGIAGCEGSVSAFVSPADDGTGDAIHHVD